MGSQASKQIEMTVVRALWLIDAFDQVVEEHKTPGWPTPRVDWRDVPMATYRKIFGDKKNSEFVMDELWTRWKEGRMQRSVLDLAANLDMDTLTKKRRKEIERGLARIREVSAS